MLSYRNDLIDTVRPFFQNLTNSANNERFNINEEKHIPFLKLLFDSQLKVLYKFEIINEEKYSAVVPKKENLSTNSSNHEEEIVIERSREIIKEDQMEKLQILIRENGINTISPIIKSFNEIKKMKIPIIIECIIQKAIKCFKYLLINGFEDPTTVTMQEQNPYPDDNYWETHHKYEWDCMSIAIYFGEAEIVKILEDRGFEKWKNPRYIEAAVLSYRNSIVKEIIYQMKEKNENGNDNINDTNFIVGLIASGKSNNIKGAEILINNGANLNAQDIIYQNIQILYLIKRI